MHCWHWCGGWAPERLALYIALHPVDDAALLLRLQEHIHQETRRRN